MTTQRDVMEYDVLIVGAGPAGLATAIHLKHLAQQSKQEISICLLDKGSEVGSHIISGCVMDPRGLDELIPNWRELDFPVTTQVNHEKLVYLTAKNEYSLPAPKDWQNYNNYIISLSQLYRKLGEYAERLGIEIYPGFAASQMIIENNALQGVITGDVGLDRNGEPTTNHQLGMEIRAKFTVLAEGCRGSLTKQVIKHFQLDKNSQPQTYGLGIKEIWRVEPHKHKQGSISHSIGYPLDNQTYGGGFIYHLADNLISIGLVTALDYTNPYLSPYEEFQKFKQHPTIKLLLENGERLEYGARTVVEGGIQALPELSFAGGIIVGDSAGLINVPKIKGVHNAIKSGIIGAISIINAIKTQQKSAANYTNIVKQSWLYQELYAVRNIRPAFQYGRVFGMLYTAFEQFVLRGRAPWTVSIKQPDHLKIKYKSQVNRIEYPDYDRLISFDKSSSIHLSNINHDDNQPLHLRLANDNVAIKINLVDYAAPETRYCPAGVYEITYYDEQPKLQINAQNCVHCKACDIKDPTQNITWVPPESGSGPQYSKM